jgi:hypothetical protein
MSRKKQSIGELELRIMVINIVLKWLRSGDPMLSDPKWSPYVPVALEHYEDQLRQLAESCRKKKVERDGDPNTNPVSVNLKAAKMGVKSKIG